MYFCYCTVLRIPLSLTDGRKMHFDHFFFIYFFHCYFPVDSSGGLFTLGSTHSKFFQTLPIDCLRYRLKKTFQSLFLLFLYDFICFIPLLAFHLELVLTLEMTGKIFFCIYETFSLCQHFNLQVF